MSCCLLLFVFLPPPVDNQVVKPYDEYINNGGIVMNTNGYQYATKNGFNGTEQEYLSIKYDGYCEVCNRCGIWPACFEQWLEQENKK